MLIGISGKIGSGKDTIGKIVQYLASEYAQRYTFEEYLVEIETKKNPFFFHSWEIKKFADKLKDIVCLLISCTREQLEDQEFKNTELDEVWWYYKDTHFNGYHMYPYNTLDKEVLDIKEELELIKLTPRLLLQLIGTECGREIIHPQIWVNALFSGYKPKFMIQDIVKDILDFSDKKLSPSDRMPNWIITDMRFPNELEAVTKREGITIRVTRTGIHTPKKEDLHPSETALDDATFDYFIDNSGTIGDLIEEVERVLIKEKII